MDDPNIDPTLVYPDSSDHAYDLPYRHSPTFASALLVTPDRDGTRGGGNGSSGKRARGEITDGEAGRVKKTRQSQSCDACRARKVRCDPPPPGTADPDLPTKDECSHCKHLGLACTFDYKPKKRGPPNLYLRRLQEGGSPFADRSSSHQSPTLPAPIPSRSPRTYPPNPTVQEVSQPYITSSSYYRSGRPSDQGGPGPGTLAEQQAMRASSFNQQGQGMAGPNGRDVEKDWEPALLMTMEATRPPPESDHELSPISSRQHQSPLRKSDNPFDAVLARHLLHHIIDLYFDNIYCLIPCLHRPTFIHDLHSSREEHAGDHEWTALVFSVVAVTLVQLPRAFVAMPRKEVKALVLRCYGLAREYLNRDFKEVTVTRCIMLYLTGVTAHILDLPYTASAIFAMNWAVMLQLRLHEESSYSGLNPIDQQLRRRIFWLQYGADRSFSAIDGGATLMNEDDCPDVALPSEVDDDYITEEGYLDQPENRTPILSGFYYISKLFRISGQVQQKRRKDKRQPPSGIMLQMRVNEVNELFAQVMGLMEDCPPALRIDMDSDGKSLGSLPDDWDMQASKDIRKLFLDPKASHAVVKDAYLVQQANIYVTQQMVRYMVLLYRDELLTIQQEHLAAQPRNGPLRRQSVTRRNEWRSLFSEEEKDEVASDLLIILQKIPIQVIAVNSMPLVTKVRFVASTLLDALTSPNNTGDESAPASQRTRRAQTYLWDFLRILSEIEALYSMTDEEPKST